MQTNKLKDQSTEDLQKQAKSIRTITYMLSGALLLLFILNIFVTIKKGFSAISAVPVALLPIVIVNVNNLNAIRKELKSREL